MASKVAQIIARGDRRWLIRIYHYQVVSRINR